MIKIKNLDDLLTNDLKGKTVYLRADLNLPSINGKVTDTTRIKSILPLSLIHISEPTRPY